VESPRLQRQQAARWRRQGRRAAELHVGVRVLRVLRAAYQRDRRPVERGDQCATAYFAPR
jgi:hypothetical protein